MRLFLSILLTISVKTDGFRNVQELLQEKNITFTRRILGGRETGNTKPYMVYLRPASSDQPEAENWLCGGVIIHEQYILTSAACIEDVKQFYVVSGTHGWLPPSDKTDPCIAKGAKKAVWKCVPKNYYFDGKEFDNSRWMVKDIAVVKVEDNFNFKRRVKGCDFIPQKIAYNNISESLVKPGTVGSIAGWGSTDTFSDVLTVRGSVNSPVLLEADVVLISKKRCKNKWEPRYHHIIDEHMICAKDTLDSDSMSALCGDQVECKDIIQSQEDEDVDKARRFVIDADLKVHTANHFNKTRKSNVASGGFCENDHGGPLIVGHGKSAMVVGVISACLTKDLTHKCHGPFLYTSIWRNRHLINCAIDKDMSAKCRRLLRSSGTGIVETKYDWSRYPNS